MSQELARSAVESTALIGVFMDPTAKTHEERESRLLLLLALVLLLLVTCLG